MKTYSYHELNPLIRLKELELLTPDMFDRLVAAKDLKEVQQLLNSTFYGEFLQGDFAETFEESLQNSFNQLITELIELAPEPEVIWIYTMRFTYHNLKALMKAELLEQNFDELFLYDGFYSLEQIKSVVKTGQSNSLPDEIIGTVNAVKAHFSESNSLQGIDVIFDRDFLRNQEIVGEKLGYVALLSEITAFIDFTNLIILGRGIRQKRSKAFLSTVLSSQGSIAKEDLLAIIEQPQTFADFILASPYGNEAASAVVDGKVDLAKLEKAKDDYLASLFEAYQVEAFGPLPMLALLHGKETEIKNLRLLVVGKKIGMDQSDIKERMRVTHDA